MKYIKKLTPVLLLCIVWITLFVVNIFKPYKSFSENENKVFSSFPKLSFETLFSGEFTSKLDTYVNEQFVLRDNWIYLRADIEVLIGKKEVNGVFICDDALIGRLDEPSEDCVDGNIAGINLFAERYSSKNISLMIVPTSSEIQSEKLPYGVHLWNQTKYINDIYTRLEYTDNIDISSSLLKAKNEYIFYRTDHHWTTYGAYLGYYAYCTANNIVPAVYNAKEVSNSFNGTLYSKSGYRHIREDTIEAFTNDFTTSLVVQGESSEHSVFYDEYLQKKDKYSYFLGTNKPLLTIYGDSSKEKKLLVFKDSYAHCMASMFSENYAEITFVDLRYLKYQLRDKINLSDYDDIFLIYGIETFVSTDYISNLPYYTEIEEIITD